MAQRVHPADRVAYVDIDPVAVAHARGLLADGGAPEGVTANDVDIRDPDAVLAAPGVAGLIDFSRPVAVLMLGVLDIIDHPDPPTLVAAYRDACSPGSALAVSNLAPFTTTAEQRASTSKVFARTPTPRLTARTADDVRALFEGYTLWEPEIVPTAGWRPDRPVTDATLDDCNALCGVGTATWSRVGRRRGRCRERRRRHPRTGAPLYLSCGAQRNRSSRPGGPSSTAPPTSRR